MTIGMLPQEVPFTLMEDILLMLVLDIIGDIINRGIFHSIISGLKQISRVIPIIQPANHLISDGVIALTPNHVLEYLLMLM